MKNTVSFRPFEERDIVFIYKCKNDTNLNKMIVGQFHTFSYEEAVKWVHGCMGKHDDFIFWAICTNDDQQRIIGWISLSNIDYVNRSACLHGVVIADKEYNYGFAWIESHLFVFDYTFEVLKLNRLYGESLVGHKQSNAAEKIFLLTREGIKRQAVFKNDRFYDIMFSSILKEEYDRYKLNGDFELSSILRRIRTLNR